MLDTFQLGLVSFAGLALQSSHLLTTSGKLAYIHANGIGAGTEVELDIASCGYTPRR